MAKNLTQQEMADKLNMTKQTYARMENGKTAMNENKLNTFAKAIGKSVQEIHEAADSNKVISILCDNTFSENTDNGCLAHSGLVVNNHYYGSDELSSQIEHLKSLLMERDKQIALLTELIHTLKNK